MSINILYQTDNNYAGYMGVSLLSLLINNEDEKELKVVIIDDNISDENKNKIESIIKKYNRTAYWIDANLIRSKTIVSEWPKYNSFRKNTNCMLKYFVFDELIKIGIDRILYIDSDTVITGSLSKLFECDMNDKAIGMTRCCLITKKYIDEIEFDENYNYYNAGINLFDVKKWVEKCYPIKLIQMAKGNRAYSTVDQDLLNKVVKDDVLDIGLKYNYQCIHDAFSSKCYSKYYRGYRYYSLDEINEAEKDHYINHFMRFCGQYPWNLKSVHPDKNIYEKYRQLSPWADIDEEESKNGSFMFKTERILYKILPKSLFIILFKKYHEKMIINSDKKVKKSVKK